MPLKISQRVCTITALLLFLPLLNAQSTPLRPKITGITSVGFYVSNPAKSIHYWNSLLGFQPAYTSRNSSDNGDIPSIMRINDHQHVELIHKKPTEPLIMFHHIGFTVDNIDQMRAYLLSKGISIQPGKGKNGPDHHLLFIKDPDGTLIEFVQAMPINEIKIPGMELSLNRISSQIHHVGYIVGNTAKSLAFYCDILGFKETWRGGSTPQELNWINVQVPDGTDYVELMLYRTYPTTAAVFGMKNHLALVSMDVPKSIETLKANAAKMNADKSALPYDKPFDLVFSKNNHRMVNTFDPDGSRIELMEPQSADGKLVPSSTAPPPPPSHD